MFSTYREGVDKHYLSSLHQQPLYTSNYTQQMLSVLVQTVKFSRRNVKTICHWLWFDSWETCGSSQTCIYHGLSRLTPRGTERTQKAVECLCGSVLTIYCTNVAICSDQKSTVCMLFPSQWTHLAFPADHPIGRFLAVQNNFLGWLYAIRCQSKLQPCAEMARKQPKERRGEQTRTMQAWWQRGSRPAKLTAAWLPPATIRQDWKAAKHPFCIASPMLKRAAHEKTSVDWSLYLQKC